MVQKQGGYHNPKKRNNKKQQPTVIENDRSSHLNSPKGTLG